MSTKKKLKISAITVKGDIITDVNIRGFAFEETLKILDDVRAKIVDKKLADDLNKQVK